MSSSTPWGTVSCQRSSTDGPVRGVGAEDADDRKAVPALPLEAGLVTVERVLQSLLDEAVDLMASQQAMPDEGALNRLADIVRAAYQAGRTEGRAGGPAALDKEEEEAEMR